MSCDKETPLITKDDFSCIYPLSVCETEAFCSAVDMAIDEMLDNWLCASMYEALITDPDNELYTTLLCGGFYTCDDCRKRTVGLKKALVHLTYSHYVVISKYKDTGKGLSNPSLLGDATIIEDVQAQTLAKDAKERAEQAWLNVEAYLECSDLEAYESCKKCEDCDKSGGIIYGTIADKNILRVGTRGRVKKSNECNGCGCGGKDCHSHRCNCHG